MNYGVEKKMHQYSVSQKWPFKA